MQSLLSPHGVYSPQDVDGVLARVFGAGVRPLRFEQALFEAMLGGWRSQQSARYLKPKTIRANEAGVRAFVEHTGGWPWEWRASHADEYFEDLLSRPQRLARSTLRAYQQRLKSFSEYACDRRYPWSVICEREFGRGPGQLFDERNLVAHLDEFEGDTRRRPLTVDELEAFFAAGEARIAACRRHGRKGSLQAWRDQALFMDKFAWGCAARRSRCSTSATSGPPLPKRAPAECRLRRRLVAHCDCALRFRRDERLLRARSGRGARVGMDYRGLSRATTPCASSGALKGAPFVETRS